MTATTTPPARKPAFRPVRAVPAETRPRLEVLPAGSGSARWRRRRARLLAGAGVVLGCAVLFGLASVHVLLTEGQFRLQRLQKQADDAQAQYVRLRLEVSQLESPERIVAAAQERLGMVPPAAVTYLTPPAPAPAAAPARSPSTTAAVRSSRTRDTTQGWALAKPALTSRP